MIVTCTMNPAIDLYVKTHSYQPKIVNRTLGDNVQPNGKGVNISFILNMMEIPNRAIGYSGGFTGEYIVSSLKENGIDTDFVLVDGFTRINVFTQVEDQQTEYKLVNPGPVITIEQKKQLYEIIAKLTSKDILCISGSNPVGVDEQDVLDLIQLCSKKGIPFVVDTSSSVVMKSLPYQPFCLKPNEEELAAFFGLQEIPLEKIPYYGEELVKRGAQQVIVSLGKEGAFYFNEQEKYYINAPKGELVNSACAGDTLLAVFLGLILMKKEPLPMVLKKSVAAASSTAFREWLTDFTDVELLMEQIVVTKL